MLFKSQLYVTEPCSRCLQIRDQIIIFRAERSMENTLDSDPQSVLLGFPGGAVVENLPANAGDTGSSPGPGRSHMPRSN